MRPASSGEADGGGIFGAWGPRGIRRDHEICLARAGRNRAVGIVLKRRHAFHVLALRPTRLAFGPLWPTGTVGEFGRRLTPPRRPRGHASPDREVLTARSPRPNGKGPRRIPPPGGALDAAIHRRPVPRRDTAAVVRRIRADGKVWHPRAAYIKAHLNRNFKKEITVLLMKIDPNLQTSLAVCSALKGPRGCAPGPERDDQGPLLRRRFRNAVIVFPRLIRLNQHHVENSRRLHG